jgi:DNA-binding MarR family transcriptional regulator
MPGLLEREISQTKPLSLIDLAGANLHRTSAVLLQEVASFLSSEDVSPKQYNILRILRGAGADGLSCGEIASRLVTPDPDITRLLDRLVARKWIRRNHDSSDRRVVRVCVSASGLALLARLEKTVQAIQERQFGKLTNKELRKLTTLLERLRSTEGRS